MNLNRFLLAAGACALFLHTSCESKHGHHEEATFQVTSPIQKDTVVFREYVSQIRSFQHIELRALEKGYLQNIYVDEGQFVKKGQLMFRIMPVIYQSEMEVAKAEAQFAEIEYLNTKALADSNVVSQNELALTKARLTKANAELSLASAHLGFTEIRAPFDGYMGRFNDVRLGSLLDEGELLSTLSDNSKMWVYFNVPEAEYLDLVTSAALDSLPQVHLQMASDFNNETGNIAFRATFPNESRILRHGETGNIQMPVPHTDALIIPQKATFEILDKKYVFVVGDDGVVQSREITILTELPHLFIVSDGIDVNDKILIEGLRKVENNQKIKFEFVSQEQVLSELHRLHAE
jgi:membrane fusion protein (multidrug efflux system)